MVSQLVKLTFQLLMSNVCLHNVKSITTFKESSYTIYVKTICFLSFSYFFFFFFVQNWASLLYYTEARLEEHILMMLHFQLKYAFKLLYPNDMYS